MCSFDELSRVVEEKVLANSTVMCYTYDELSRVTKRTVTDEYGETVSEESYSYDAAGNIIGAQNDCFEYDANNRLTYFNGQCVDYDLDGNMLSNGSITCTYDSSNRLITAEIGVYSKIIDGNICYAIVNAGSEYLWDTNKEDIIIDYANNLTQPVGLSQDVRDSISYAKNFVKAHNTATITFIGHSKDGAEALANAMATNKDAIIFNSAKLNYRNYGLNPLNYTGKVTSYVVIGDLLNTYVYGVALPLVQAVTPTWNYFDEVDGPPRFYKNIYLTPKSINPIDNHSIDAIISGYNKKYIDH